MNKCLKCDKYFKPRDKQYQTQVARELCEGCEKAWHEFYRKHSKMVESAYPNRHNPTWDVYLGILEDITPEVVEFT